MSDEDAFAAFHINLYGFKPPRYVVTFVSKCHVCDTAMTPGETGSFDHRAGRNKPAHYYCMLRLFQNRGKVSA